MQATCIKARTLKASFFALYQIFTLTGLPRASVAAFHFSYLDAIISELLTFLMSSGKLRNSFNLLAMRYHYADGDWHSMQNFFDCEFLLLVQC